jgi:glycosyltransferase involved in cell wall biosynthesis
MNGRWPSVSRNDRETVGIVVPVLNDAGPLGGLLASLGKTGVNPGQVVVVDGGSTDDSAGVARRWGAHVLESPRKGRGAQVSLGAGVLDSDLVLVLHADNRVPPGILKVLRRASAAYPRAVGGAFRLAYGTPGLRMRVLSVFSNAKASLFGLSFGDQGQWFRNKTVSVPEIPLMEDVELAVRMNDSGGSVWTPATLEVSIRRYSEKGTLSVLRGVVVFTLGYLFRRRWEGAPPDTTDLYRKYYGERKEAPQ